MKTKLLYGIIGFVIGGVLVAIAATAFDKPESTRHTDMTTEQMLASLKDKKGHDYDSEFLTEMIRHHKSAIEMAKLSASNAEHDELKQLSLDIIDTQEKEVDGMRQWQEDWSYIIPLRQDYR